MTKIQVLQADIVTLTMDVIVNAANTTLLGGGGVDGAIHLTAGPGLLSECRALGGCETGDAKITSAYRLPCKFVIHAVGPVWHGGSRGESRLLAACYRRSLELTNERQLKSIAFPCISTGVFGYPSHEAALIAIREVKQFVSTPTSLEWIVFCCYTDRDMRVYQELLSQ